MQDSIIGDIICLDGNHQLQAMMRAKKWHYRHITFIKHEVLPWYAFKKRRGRNCCCKVTNIL